MEGFGSNSSVETFKKFIRLALYHAKRESTMYLVLSNVLYINIK